MKGCSSFSILVLRGVIFVSGLDAVVSVTEALPVALVPEAYGMLLCCC